MSASLAISLVAFGVLAGVASGLLGIGGGTVMVPYMVLVAGFSQHEAEATSLLVILPTAIVGSLVLRANGVGDLRRALLIGALGSVGGLAGASLALALPSDALRLLFAIFIAIIGARMALQAHRALRERAGS